MQLNHERYDHPKRRLNSSDSGYDSIENPDNNWKKCIGISQMNSYGGNESKGPLNTIGGRSQCVEVIDGYIDDEVNNVYEMPLSLETNTSRALMPVGEEADQCLTLTGEHDVISIQMNEHDDDNTAVTYKHHKTDTHPQVSMFEQPHVYSSTNRRSRPEGKNPMLDEENVKLKTSTGNKEKDTDTNSADSPLFPKKIGIAIILISVLSCGTGLLLIFGHTHEVPQSDVSTIRLACANLTKVYPVASLYHHTDDVTNGMFEAQGIRRIHNYDTGVTLCEVPRVSLMERLSADEYNGVHGQFELVAASKGPPRPSSSYELSVIKAAAHSQMTHSQNFINIHQEGDYFVFLKLELAYNHEKHPRCRSLRYKTFISHVLVQEAVTSRPQTLMGLEHTCCRSCNDELKSRFAGGLFHLRQNDRISIQVSSPKSLKQSGEHSLGVFRMKNE